MRENTLILEIWANMFDINNIIQHILNVNMFYITSITSSNYHNNLMR